MKITIIEAGRPPSPLDSDFGDYPHLFGRLLNAEAEHFGIDGVAAFEGEPLPYPDGLDAILITGSPAGVYDDRPWIEPMREFVRRAYAAGTPMVGICFGHQIMADALGGQARKSERGWGVGRQAYDIVERPAFMADAPARIAIPASHQDQVITAPEDAMVIARSDFTPFAGLFYRSGRAVSFQPHPEFSPAFAAALFDIRHRHWLGDEATNQAIASLSEPTDNALLGSWIAQFFHGFQ